MTTTKICEHMRFTDDVICTSIEYLKRFYLKQSLYDFDGLDMMYTAIYLSIKVEEVNYRLHEFSAKNKGCSAEKVVQYETFLIKGLKFQFFIYSPYRSLNGFRQILTENSADLAIDNFESKMEEIYRFAHKAIRKLHFTD